MHSRLPILRDSIREGYLEGTVMGLGLAHSATAWLSRHRRAAVPMLIGLGLLLGTGSAVADPTITTPQTPEGAACNSGGSTTSLYSWIDQITLGLLAVGSAVFVLMLCWGAAMITFGHKPAHVRKGREIVKASCIGMMALAGGGVIRFIVNDFLITSAHSLGDTSIGTTSTCKMVTDTSTVATVQ